MFNIINKFKIYDSFEIKNSRNKYKISFLPHYYGVDIRIAAENPKIQGIRLRSDFISSGWAQTHSIRKALKDFKSNLLSSSL